MADVTSPLTTPDEKIGNLGPSLFLIDGMAPATSDEVIERTPADAVGDFAIQAWQNFQAGNLTPIETQNAAKVLLDKLHALAIKQGIIPPEKAIFELEEHGENAAVNLLETGINADERNPLDTDVIERIERQLDYAYFDDPEATNVNESTKNIILKHKDDTSKIGELSSADTHNRNVSDFGPSRERTPFDEVGDFAIQAWKDFQEGNLTPKQIQNAAKLLIGKLSAFALEQGIKPPQKAIFELNEDVRFVVLGLLEIGINANRKPLHPDTVKRIQSQLDYANDPNNIPLIASPGTATISDSLSGLKTAKVGLIRLN